MWKLCSMYMDAEARKAELMAQDEMSGGVIFKMKDDPRVTKVGKFIRKTSIDALPQLWNVLTGEMSLVGPCPAGAVVRYRPRGRKEPLIQACRRVCRSKCRQPCAAEQAVQHRFAADGG